MCAVVKFRQHAQESEATNGAPADEFDEAVGGIGVRSDQHGAAGVLAVVEGEKEAAALVPIFVIVAAQDEGAAAKLRYANENSEKVADRAEGLEATVGEGGYVSSKSDTN